MGACDFTTTAHGKTAQEAFYAAVEQAQWEYGHGGYTGTIAEKSADGFLTVTRPERATAAKTAEQIRLAAMADMYAYHGGKVPADIRKAHAWVSERFSPVGSMLAASMDKWGPALCVEASPSEAAAYKVSHGLKGTRARVFVFFGTASM